MSLLAWGMTCAGTAILVAGALLAWPRVRAASGVGKLLQLALVFEAAPLAVFSMEHFFDSRDLMGMVPHWLPGPLFWTYFVGVALLAAAISFIAWRCVGWAAALLALLFLIIVATIDLPKMAAEAHDRLFWTLTVRETAFASGAIVLAGSLWPGKTASAVLIRIGRAFLAATFVFYAIEHFLFPRNVPGVPLEKMTPDWMPAPTVIAYFVGIILLVSGVGLLLRRTVRLAAAGSGAVLLLLTAFFYVPILFTEIRTPLVVEGLNYVFDTMLFAATALLAGFGPDQPSPISPQS